MNAVSESNIAYIRCINQFKIRILTEKEKKGNHSRPIDWFASRSIISWFFIIFIKKKWDQRKSMVFKSYRIWYWTMSLFEFSIYCLLNLKEQFFPRSFVALNHARMLDKFRWPWVLDHERGSRGYLSLSLYTILLRKTKRKFDILDGTYFSFGRNEKKKKNYPRFEHRFLN